MPSSIQEILDAYDSMVGDPTAVPPIADEEEDEGFGSILESYDASLPAPDIPPEEDAPVYGFSYDIYPEAEPYREYIEAAETKYGIPKGLLANLIMAESNFNPLALSPDGAIGLMQIMPKTFKEITKKNPSIKGTREQPRWNIAAGIYYDRMIWKVWKAKRPFEDRINFMFGSYNAGKGNVLKAQEMAKRKGMDPNLWESIEPTLPDITGKRSRETIGYVKKIHKIKGVLK